MPYSIQILRLLDELDPVLRKAFLAVLEEIERHMREGVTKSDFDELRKTVAEIGEAVRELAQAQRRTEERISGLEKAMEELAQAQKRTEERMEELAQAQKRSEERISRLEAVVEELAQAQKRTEERVEQLAQAQKRTEERVEQLAQAQKRTEERVSSLEEVVKELAQAQKRSEERISRLEAVVEELAQAQKRTEQELRELAKEHRITREIIGDLQATIGHGLEDKIMPFIFSFGKKVYGVDVEMVERKNLVYPDGRYDELNIYAEGVKGDEKVYLIGECKSKPGKKDVDKFMKVIGRVRSHLRGTVYPFMVGYTYNPEVESYISKTYPELRFLKSYEFELKYGK